MHRIASACLIVTACGGPTNPDPGTDAATSLTEPSGLEVFERHATELALRWQPGDAHRFALAYAKGTAAPAACSGAGVITSDQTSVTVSGLEPHSDYAFRLCSVDDHGGTSAGITAADRTLALVPGEASALQVTGDAGTLGVAWTAGAGATSYLVAYAEGATAPASCTGGQATSATHVAFTGLAAGRTYAVRVCALNDNPTPDVSAGATATGYLHSPIAADPTNVTADLHDAWIKLAWSGSAPAYKVVLDPTDAAAGCTGAGEVTTRTTIVLPVAAKTLYHARICASNGDSQPLYSTGLATVLTSRAVVVPHVNGLYCADGGNVIVHWSGAGMPSQYFMTVAPIASATAAPACTSQNVTAINPSTSGSGFYVGFPYGTGHGERYWMRICFYDGAFDQGQATDITTPDVSGSFIIPGSCTAQQNLALPTLTMQSASQMVTDQVMLSGTCSPAGATVQLGGDVAATSVACPVGGAWSATVAVTAAGAGTIRVAGTAWDDTRYEGATTLLALTRP